MKTMYYETSSFIQHSGNMVDLEEFRRRTALAQRDSLARQPEEELWTEGEEETREESDFRPVILTITQKDHRRARRERQAWTLDACASLAVVFMTLVFALRMIL